MATKGKYRNTRTRYGLVHQVLHWASVALMIVLIVTSDKLSDIQESTYNTALIMQHASWGVLFLLLMLLRLYWRTTNLNPVHFYHMPDWQKFGATFLHRFIYFILITQSLIGLCSVYFSGHDITFFNFFDFPSPEDNNESLSYLSKSAHYSLSTLIYSLLTLHICAALYHQLFSVLDDEEL